MACQKHAAQHTTAVENGVAGKTKARAVAKIEAAAVNERGDAGWCGVGAVVRR